MKDTIIIIAFCGLVVFGISSCQESEWYKNNERMQEEKRREERTPRLVSEKDGCKVYTFKGGDQWHYFTRCQQTTVTDTAIRKTCGKGCAKTEISSIQTNNQ